jgi:hypothetical protein
LLRGSRDEVNVQRYQSSAYTTVRQPDWQRWLDRIGACFIDVDAQTPITVCSTLCHATHFGHISFVGLASLTAAVLTAKDHLRPRTNRATTFFPHNGRSF